MRLILPLLLLCTCSLLLGTAHQKSADDAHAESPLHEEMNGLKKNLKGLAMGFRDPDKKAQMLERVAAMQRHALVAKGLAPSNLESLPEDEREQHAEDYRRDMITLMRTLLELEENLLDDDTEAVWKKITGALFKHREASHELYQE